MVNWYIMFPSAGKVLRFFFTGGHDTIKPEQRMIVMKKRHSELLQLMQTAPSQKFSCEFLATRFSVSERTVRNDIREINEWLPNNLMLTIEKGLVKASGHDGGPANFSAVLKKSDYYTYVLSAQERVLAEAVILVSNDANTTTTDLAEQLSVSRSTIVSDMRSLRKLLKEHGIQLLAKTNIGYRVKAEETVVRQFLWYVLQTSGQDSKSASAFSALVLKELSKNTDADLIKKLLINTEHAFDFELTDEDFEKLHLYLLIVAGRIAQQHNLPGKPASQAGGWFSVANAILGGLGISGKPSQQETDPIAQLLMQSQYISGNKFSLEYDFYLQMKLSSFVYDVAAALGILNQMDFAQFQMLLQHIETSLRRRRNCTNESDVKNDPLITELEQIYPDVFGEVNKRRAALMESPGELGSEELAYIAVYLVSFMEAIKVREKPVQAILVCSAGMCTAMLLQARLKQYFHIHIREILSLHKFDEINLEGIDLIISTVPLSSAGVPVAHISPMLSEADVELVHRMLESTNNMRMSAAIQSQGLYGMEEYLKQYREIVAQGGRSDDLRAQHLPSKEKSTENPFLHEILCADDIALDVPARDWTDAIGKAGMILERKGVIEHRYISKMVELVNKNGPYIVFVPGLAIAHAGIRDGALRLGISLVRLANPIAFNHPENDPVRLVACISPQGDKKHLYALFNLIKMASSTQIQGHLLLAKQPEEVLEIIRYYELTNRGGGNIEDFG